MRGGDVVLGRRTTGPKREAQDHVTGRGLCPRWRRKAEDQTHTRLLANLRNDMLREVGEVRFDIVEAVVAPEWLAQNPGHKSIDQRIALLCRHEVLHR